MSNILIYTDNNSSSTEKLCKAFDADAQITVKKSSEISNLENENADVAITDMNTDEIKKISAVMQFPIPVLLITDEIPVDIKIRGEAFDFVVKPVSEYEAAIRLSNLIRIKNLKDKINGISTIDELTGLHNRKFLAERIESEMARSKRYNVPLSCVLFDIDFFKTVNDMYGYECGDVLLKKIAGIISDLARKEDVVTRYGDEEYLVLLPDTPESKAFIFAERVRRDIEKMSFIPQGEDEKHPVKISGGVASYPFADDYDANADTLIRYAEHALYNAKTHGKNKIVLFSQVNMDF